MTMTEVLASVADTTTVAAVPAADLARMLGNAALFTSNDGGVIDNVRCEVVGGTFSVEATDRYVLLSETLEVAQGCDQPTVFYVARAEVVALVKAAKASAKAYRSCPVNVTILVTDGKARFVGPSDDWSIQGQACTTTSCAWPDVAQLRRQQEADAHIAKGKGLEAVTFSPHILGLLGKVVGSEEARTSAKAQARPGLTFTFGPNPSKPVMVTAHASPGLSILVMPHRG